MKKRTLVSTLFVLFVLMVFTVSQVSASSAFNDVPSDYWASKEISQLYKKGIVSGDENGNFNPERSITRAETAVMISRALNLDTNVTGLSFNDVSSDFYAYQDIMAVSNAGIMVGSDQMFNPNATLTRAEMAAVLVKAFDLKGNGEANFTDVKDSWAKEAIDIVASNGITAGYEDNTFRPNQPIKRSEFAVFLVRTLDGKDSELAQLLKEVYKNELDINSYQFSADANIGIQLPPSATKDLPAELSLLGAVLNDINLSVDGVYELDPMKMEMDLSITLGGGLNLKFDVPVIMTEEKMLIQLPNNIPGASLPEEIDGKFIEFNLDELAQLDGMDIGTFNTSFQFETELALAIYDLVIDNFTDAFYEYASLDAISYPETINAKEVVKFELSNSNLKRFLIIVAEDFLPPLVELMAEPQYAQYFGISPEDSAMMVQEIETIQAELIKIIPQITESVNIHEFNIYSVINEDNIIQYNEMNINVDITVEGETLGIKFYSTDERQNINGQQTFKYDQIDPNEIISFVELMDMSFSEEISE